MKWAVAGKGGVGKTTVTAGLARSLAALGRHVFLIDADPDPNLAGALGVALGSQADDHRLRPLVQSRDLIQERIGAQGLLRLNPDLSDIPEQFRVQVGPNLWLMVVGAVGTGGGGCACGANVLVKSLIGHVLLEQREDVLIDLEAGVEHLGRATVAQVDALIVVAEPSPRSVETIARIRTLAGQIGLTRILAVGNRVDGQAQADRLREQLDPVPLVGLIGEHPGVRRADAQRQDAYLSCPEFAGQVDAIRDTLLDRHANKPPRVPTGSA